MKKFRVELQKSYFANVNVIALNTEDAEEKAFDIWEKGNIEWEGEEVDVADVEQI